MDESDGEFHCICKMYLTCTVLYGTVSLASVMLSSKSICFRLSADRTELCTKRRSTRYLSSNVRFSSPTTCSRSFPLKSRT